jgi:hypothetical protein
MMPLGDLQVLEPSFVAQRIVNRSPAAKRIGNDLRAALVIVTGTIRCAGAVAGGWRSDEWARIRRYRRANGAMPVVNGCGVDVRSDAKL